MIDFFIAAYKDASLLQIILETCCFFLGILSVWYAKKENILVYPTGLISTVITVYLLYVAKYYGDMTVNIYFSIMSIYGWYHWSKSTNDKLVISRTNTREKLIGLLLFIITTFVVYIVYVLSGHEMEWVNYIDLFTSGLFFTGMWFMANKKIENWTLWIIGDAIAVPLYAYRGLGILSLQYLIFTVLAIIAYLEWKKSLNNTTQIS